MKKLLLSLLTLACSTSFAGSYSDDGIVADSAQDQQSRYKHFYVNAGVTGYELNTPDYQLPFSTGSADEAPYPTSESSSLGDNQWDPQFSLAFGYQFLNAQSNWFTDVFGMENSIELRASYLNSKPSEDANYNGAPGNVWFIDGNPAGPVNDGESWNMQDSESDFDNTYQEYGVYYIGNKLIANRYINAPYFGVNFVDLTQDTTYTLNGETAAGSPQVSSGTDDVESFYFGLDLGDKFTVPFANHYGVYGSLGLALYGMHTDMTATQIPATPGVPLLTNQITVSESDDIVTFNAKAEIGFTYFFNNNFDTLSPSVTLLSGIEYWNDMAYVDNPNQANTAATIGYDSSVSPYAGLQVHVPIN